MRLSLRTKTKQPQRSITVYNGTEVEVLKHHAKAPDGKWSTILELDGKQRRLEVPTRTLRTVTLD